MEHETAKIENKAVGRLPLQAAPQPKTAEAGQSLLELALLLPFLLVLLLGVAEVGRVVFISIAVTNAASAGVEYGAQNSGTASDSTGMQNAAIADANISVMSTPVATHGCVCDTGGISCNEALDPTACPTAGTTCGANPIVECVKVTTHATFSSLFHYPGLPASFTTNGKAVMRVRP